MSLAAGVPAAADTGAGTAILNTATLRYATDDGSAHAIDSNTDRFLVDERLDVALVRVGDGPVVVPAGGLAVPVTLQNAGNGNEAFVIATDFPTGGASVTGIAIDSDGNGRYDAAVDTMLADDTTTLLAAGTSLRLLVILVPGTAAMPVGATLRVTATAATGSGTPGTTFPGKGDGGGDAVVGPTHATATVVVPLSAVGAAPSLAKSQSVLAPDGSGSAVTDAVVTYTLAAQFTGAATAAQIDDPLPTGTTFVPGSITLDGTAQSDAADGDAGSFDGKTVSVSLGDIAAASVRTVTFKAKIQ